MAKRRRKKKNPYPFSWRLKSSETEILWKEDEEGYGEARDKKFRYRWFPDKVQVALSEGFDRWANSVAFVLYRDLDRIDPELLKEACRLAIQKGKYDAEWADVYDVATYYRKAKRLSKSS